MPEFLDERREEMIALCRRHRVRRLELFGSATSASTRSGATSTPPAEHSGCYFGLLFGLEDLFERGVHLVEIGAIRNRYFLRAIARQRRVLYETEWPRLWPAVTLVRSPSRRHTKAGPIPPAVNTSR